MKEFSKFFVASLKRTAQNVSPLVRRKQKLQAEIAERENELVSIQKQLDTYEAPIKEATGGFGTEDLVVRTVEITDKVDKDGKPIKVTKWSLKYPETIVPVEEEGTNVATPIKEVNASTWDVPTTEGGFGSDYDADVESVNRL